MSNPNISNSAGGRNIQFGKIYTNEIHTVEILDVDVETEGIATITANMYNEAGNRINSKCHLQGYIGYLSDGGVLPEAVDEISFFGGDQGSFIDSGDIMHFYMTASGTPDFNVEITKADGGSDLVFNFLLPNGRILTTDPFDIAAD